MSDERSDVAERVRGTLADAEEPLTTGRIQRRIAGGGLDVATGAVRAACEELVEAGIAEPVGEPPRVEYRLVD